MPSVRVLIRKANSIASGGAGSLTIGAHDLITDSGDWTQFTSLYEEFKINSIRVKYYPGFRATQESQNVIIAHGAYHDPGEVETRADPTSLVDALENPAEYAIKRIAVANAPHTFQVPLNQASKLWSRCEDEAAQKVTSIYRQGWIETQLISKTLGTYVVEWDITFR